MGRPFADELDQLPITYSWAIDYDVEPLVHIIHTFKGTPLLAAGSGGSFTTAKYWCDLHTWCSGQLAHAATPLAAAKALSRLNNPLAVALLTASGANIDILGLFRTAVAAEPQHLAMLCASKQSQLAKVAAAAPYANLFEFSSPAVSDGFLATNSLIASCTLLLKAHAYYYRLPFSLPHTWSSLLSPVQPLPKTLKSLKSSLRPLLDRNTLVILHDNVTTPAALDLESKLTEAALVNVQLADFRNFAHGRHNWLAKRGDETAVLCLVTDKGQQLASATLDLLPKTIPQARVELPHNELIGSLAAIGFASHITAFYGEAKDVDPGQPDVPSFGAALFNLTSETTNRTDNIAINRKAGHIQHENQLGDWQTAEHLFRKRLSNTRIRAVIFDYDGTLVHTTQRFCPPKPAVAKALERLLAHGIQVAIATGRGDSVRHDLKSVLSRELWPRVILGYYNCAEIGALNNDNVPDRKSSTANPILRSISERLTSNSEFRNTAKLRQNKYQISVESHRSAFEKRLWDLVQNLTLEFANTGISILCSSHSIDILAPGVSKLNLINYLTSNFDLNQNETLVIGDSGLWPGNDSALLSAPVSLSVDKVSPCRDTCWNLAPSGFKGPDATLAYCQSLQLARDQCGAYLKMRM